MHRFGPGRRHLLRHGRNPLLRSRASHGSRLGPRFHHFTWRFTWLFGRGLIFVRGIRLCGGGFSYEIRPVHASIFIGIFIIFIGVFIRAGPLFSGA
jgi:hypothetical protein